MTACYCDYEPAEVFVKTNPKARVEHRCGECYRPIPRGEVYERVFGVWDGDVSTHKTCQRCIAVREFVTASVPCFCWYYGDMLDNAKECASEWSHEADGLLFGTLRRIILAKGKRRRTADGQRIEP